MNRVAVVYWSGTGNTGSMAAAVAEGVMAQGAQADVWQAAKFDPALLDSYDAIAFGCPAMGAEELEEEEFAPMFAACEGKLRGRRMALFGSYGWGSGEWMRAWEAACRSAGAILAADSVTCCGAPDSAAPRDRQAARAALAG